MESFKSFGTAQFAPLAPLTLIYGPNSGGKSSIIQSLLLIKQSLVSSRSSLNMLDFNGQLTDLGDFPNTVFRHEQKPLQLGFSYGAEFFAGETLYTLPPVEYGRSIDFTFEPVTETIKLKSGKKHKRRYIGLRRCTYKVSEQGNSSSPILKLIQRLSANRVAYRTTCGNESNDIFHAHPLCKQRLEAR
jgi:hypothetical protein